MNKPRLLGQCLLIAASVLLLPSTGAFANAAMPGQGGMFHHASSFDWVKHTQQTLDELKGKLSDKRLDRGQPAARFPVTSSCVEAAHD